MYLSFADLEGIFSFNSFDVGTIGFFLIILNRVSGWFSFGTYLETLLFSDKLLKKYLTILSSSEWNVSTAITPSFLTTLAALIYGLINAAKVVKKDGVIAVVTFHSLEDKIVKYFFKSLSENKSVSRHMPKTEEKLNLFKSVIKKPIVPSDKEIRENPPSRSAKLRYVIKKEDFFDFETDILDKFKHLIDIENLSNKLWNN